MKRFKLAAPIFSVDSRWEELEVRIPNPGTLADVARIAENGGIYPAIQTFISGSVEQFFDATGKAYAPEKPALKILIGEMPYISALQAVSQISCLILGDDRVSGVYECDQCGAKNRYGKSGEMDTRDSILALPVKYFKGEQNRVAFDLETPAEVKAENGEILVTVKQMAFRFPTLNDCQKVTLLMGERDKIRLQWGIHIEALTEIDGAPVDHKWKKEWGMLVFERMSIHDQQKIFRKINSYGVNLEVKKACRECGSDFDARINTQGFFASALRMS